MSFDRQRMNECEDCLQRLAGTGAHSALLEMLDMDIEDARFQLEATPDTVRMYRQQGKIAALRMLKQRITPVKKLNA